MKRARRIGSLPWLWSLVGCVGAAALLAMAGAAHSIRIAGGDTNPVVTLARTSGAGVTTVASYRGLSYGPSADFEDVATLLWDGPDGYPALELIDPDRLGFANVAAFRPPSAGRSSPGLDRELDFGATTPVPEPSPAVLLMGGLTALAWIRRRARIL